MDSVLRTVQRYLYIGSDVPFVRDPSQPLDVELGKKILERVVQQLPKPEEAPAESKKPLPPVVEAPKAPEAPLPNGTGETEQKKKKLKQKKLNAKLNREVEKEDEKKGEEGVKSKAPQDAATTTPTVPKEAKATEPVAPKSLHPVLALIKTAYKSKSLCRTDECLFALAFCARNFPPFDERHAVYDVLVELVRTSNDLLQFVSYYIQLATQAGHAGFGHGLRVAIARWYDKFSAVELAELLGRSTKHAGWSHRDLIAKAHTKLSCPDKQSLIDAATKRTSQLLQKKAPEKKGKKKKQQNGPEPPPEQVLVPLSTTKAFKRYQTLLQFKSVGTVGKALELIKQHGGKGRMELLPKHLRRSIKVWEALYPYLTYRELLHAALPLQDFRLLKEGETSAKTYAESLTKRFDALEAEHVHPIEVQRVAKLYENGKRYNSHMKQVFYMVHHTDPQPPVKAVLEGLNAAFVRSFEHINKTGVRYYITLDLRCVHEKQRVFCNEAVTCLQASVLLAFAIFKREKSVTVTAFSDEADALTLVQFEPTMTWDEALKLCTGLMLPKTKASLTAPIKLAEVHKMKVDVFITITDSLIRVNPTRRPPVAEMTEYRKKFKLPLSRYLAISLNRHEPSLNFTPDMDTGGILEMVGHSANNAKIIEAFAKNIFH